MHSINGKGKGIEERFQVSLGELRVAKSEWEYEENGGIEVSIYSKFCQVLFFLT